ncbi:MAG: uncharacterized protein QOF85_415 [Solirubrobacterales bacterium]|jgi:uncharacterized repeat protein (TIGR01451 family)|nr:uncharacterized protein [Solirubrobacterales bacterium]
MRSWWIFVITAALVCAFADAGMAAKAGSADLAITKADSPDPVAAGSTLTYTIHVQNFGPDIATGVTVTDQLPKGVDFVSATTTAGKCVRKGRKVSCDLGQVGVPAVDYSAPPTVTLSAIPRQIGVISNTASVKGSQKDPVASNNKATATTSVVGPPPTCRGVIASIVGTAADDAIVGTPGRDVIATFQGNDTIVSLSGRDLVCAGSGDDYIGSGSAADRVFGGAGRDRLLGRGGPDVLGGGPGPDILKGNRGADRLRGGPGSDRCRGGAGVDSIRGCERL